jgi:hypothetical protein
MKLMFMAFQFKHIIFFMTKISTWNTNELVQVSPLIYHSFLRIVWLHNKAFVYAFKPSYVYM